MTNGLDFGSRAEASRARVAELNPRVQVKIIPGDISDKVNYTLYLPFFVDFFGIFTKKKL